MFSLNFFLVLISLILFEACGSSKEHNLQNRPDETVGSETTEVKKDTIPPVPPPERQLPPGTARIKGRLITMENGNNNQKNRMAIKVTSVMGYGSSTPPIGITDTLQISIPADTLQLLKNAKKGKELVSIIRYHQIMDMGTTGPAFSWMLVKIESNTD